MGNIKKIVLEMEKYFKETYSDNLFQKVISMVVVVCLVVNIVNLPAFASEKRVKDNKEKNEQVIKSGKTDTSETGLINAQEAMKSGSGEGVSVMNAIGNMSEKEVNSIIEIDEQNGVIKDKTKGNKVVAVYNAEKKQVLGYAGQKDIVYYQALVNRKNFLEKDTEVVSQERQTTKEKTSIEVTAKVDKTAQEIAEEKGTVIGEYKAEGKKGKTTDNDRRKLGFSDGVIIFDEEQGYKRDIVLNLPIESLDIPDGGQDADKFVAVKPTLSILTRADSFINDTEETETNKKEVVERLSQNIGVSEEEVKNNLEEALKGKTQEEQENIIGLLKTFFDNGGDIVNCAVDALKKVLDIHSKGVLGLQALLIEISTGLFVKNNEDLINSGETQLMTSMSTMQQIMQHYGLEAEGYSTNVESFIANTKSGESAIVWVNIDHYITVTKLDDGNYGVVDSNVNDGRTIKYSAEGLKNVLSGKEGIDVYGKKVGVSYKAQTKDGTIKVLAVSESLKQAKEEGKVLSISKKEMVKIKGANTTITDDDKAKRSQYETKERANTTGLSLEQWMIESQYETKERANTTITDKDDKDKNISISNNGATVTDSKTGEKKVITFDKNLSEEQLKSEKEFIAKYGISAWEEHIRGEGLLEQETLYDKEGRKIYIAEKVGYDANSHTIALKYSFYQAYTDDIYFVNSQNIKLVVQTYKKDKDGLLKEDVTMVYSVATNARSEEYEFENGIKVNMAISNIDRIVEKGEVVEKEEKDDKGNIVKINYQEYRAIDYSNANNINNGIPTGLENIKVYKDGHKEFTRYELANFSTKSDDDKKDKENDENKEEESSYSNSSKNDDEKSKSDKDDMAKEYKEMLEKTEQLKIKDYDVLYTGYKYVDQSYIVGVVSYNTQTQLWMKSWKVGDLDLTASVEGVGSNWRYLKSLSEGTKINIQSRGKDINGKDVVYIATGELTAEYSNWGDIKNIKVGEDVIICGYTKNDEGEIVYDPCYRKSGKFSEERGFYGADLGEYSDYFTSIKTEDGESISIYNIKRTADGKYVAQQNKEDKYASTYYMTKEKSKLKIKDEKGNIQELGEERERDVMFGIKDGIVFEKNEDGDVILKDGDKNVELKDASGKQIAILPNEQDLKDIEDYYSVTQKTKTKNYIIVKKKTTTVTIKYATWDEEEGVIEHHTRTTKTTKTSLSFFNICDIAQINAHLTVTDNGKKLVDKHYGFSFEFIPVWSKKDESLCRTFEQFARGKVDFNKKQMKFINDAGIDIKNYTEGTEHRVDISINVPKIEQGKVVQYYQNTQTYKTDGSYILNKAQPLSVQVGSYYVINGVQSPDPNDGFIHNARGVSSRVDYYYKNNGERIVVGHGNFVQNAFVDYDMCVATKITDGIYYKAKEQLDENNEVKKDDNGDTLYEIENDEIKYYEQNWEGITNFSSCSEKVIGSWFNHLSKEDKEKMRVIISSSDGEEITLQLCYKDGELTYEYAGGGKTVYELSADEVAKKILSGEKITVQRTYYKDGKQMCECVKDKKLSDFAFNKNFSGNDGERSFSINSISFDSSQGFYVDANLQLTQEEFKVTGSTIINSGDSSGDNGDIPKEVKDKKYGVDVSIDGDDMILKASDDNSRHEVSISFGLNELTSGSATIGNYSFGYFYAGTEITFYNQADKIVESENIGRRDVSNATEDAGDITYQKITVTGIKDGSKVLLTTNTGLGDLAGAIANNGFKEGSATVTNEIAFEVDGKHEVEYIKIVAKMEKGKSWESAKKTFYYKANIEGEYKVARKGQKMLGGKYDGDCKVKISFQAGSIDFNSSATQISIKRNGFMRVLLNIGGILLAMVAIHYCPFLLPQAASLLKDKKIESVTNGEILSSAVAGLAGTAIIELAVAGAIATPFTGGTSALVAFVAITALMIAVTTYFGSKAAFDASEGYQMYAKTGDSKYLKEAILSTVIFALSCFGAYGVGGSAANLVNSFVTGTLKQCFITGAKYAAIGSGVGVGVGMTVNTIRAKIQGKKWNEGIGKAILIGAIAGFFIGFMAGFSMGASAVADGVEAGVGNFIKSGWLSFKNANVFAKIGNILGKVMKAVDVLITVVQARNMVETIKNGDIEGAVSSFYVMFAMNIINPMFSEVNKTSQSATDKESVMDILKKTSGAYELNANRQLVFSASTLTRSMIFGAIGFVGGYLIGLLINSGEEDKINPFIFAAAGALILYGFSSAIATGAYRNFKISSITDGLKQISLSTFQMTNKMLQFNLELQTIASVIGVIRHVAGASKLSESDSGWSQFIRRLDSFTGFGLVKSEEALIFDEEGNFSIFNTYGVSESAKNTTSNVISPSMLLFSGAIAVGMPIAGPLLTSTPLVGLVMRILNKAQNFINDKGLGGEFLDTFLEEGFKENMIGLLGENIFGKNSQFGEIFQELFDDNPDADIDIIFLNSESATLESKGITGKTITKAVELIEKAQKADAKRQEAIDYLTNKDNFGLDRNVVDNLIDTKDLDVKKIFNEIVKETVFADMIARSVITKDTAVDFRNKLEREIDLGGLPFAQQANYIYALAMVYVSNENNVGDFNNLSEIELKNTATQGLLNLVSVYSYMDNKGTLALTVANIIKERISNVIEAKEKGDEKAISKALLDGKFYDQIEKINVEIEQIRNQIQNIRGQVDNNIDMGTTDNKEIKKLTDQLKQKQEEVNNFITNDVIFIHFANTTRLLEAMINEATVKWTLYGEQRQEYKNFEKAQKDFITETQKLTTRITDILLKIKFNKTKDKLKEDLLLIEKEISSNSKGNKVDLLKEKQQIIKTLIQLSEENTTAIEYFKILDLVDNNEEKTVREWFLSKIAKGDEKEKLSIVADLKKEREILREEISNYIQNEIDSNFRLSKEQKNLLKKKYLEQIKTMNITSLLLFNLNLIEQTSINKTFNLVDRQTIKAFEKQKNVRIENFDKLLKACGLKNGQINNDTFKNNSKDIKNLLSTLGYDTSEITIDIKYVNNIIREENTKIKVQSDLIQKATAVVEATNIEEYKKAIRDIEVSIKENEGKTLKQKMIDTLTNNLKEGKQAVQDRLYKMKNEGNNVEDLEKVLKYYNKRINEVSAMSVEELMSNCFAINQFALNIQQSEEVKNKLEDQYKNIKILAETNIDDENIKIQYATMEMFFGAGGVFQLLEKPGYGQDLKVVEDNNDIAKKKIMKVFGDFQEYYWKKFDKAILTFINSYNDSQNDINKKITNTQQLREFINSNTTQSSKLKQLMIQEAFGNDKTDKNLIFTERLALDLKISEMAYGVFNFKDDLANGNIGALLVGPKVNNLTTVYTPNNKEINNNNLINQYYSENNNIDNYGYGILGANSEVGTNTGNQVLMMCENLLGRISSLSAGGGKSHVYGWTIDMFFSLNSDSNQLNIAEIFGAKSTDAAQLSGKSGKLDDDMNFMWNMMQIETVNGEQQYQDGNKKNDYSELAKSYTDEIKEGYKGRIVTFSLGTRGFVELQARVGENATELNTALNNVTIRIFDEADVAALSKTAFILATGNNTVSKLKAAFVVECLQELQKIEINGKRIKANTEAKVKADLKENEFAVIDGQIVCADDLREEIIKKFKNEGLNPFTLVINKIAGVFNKNPFGVDNIEDLQKYNDEVTISDVMRAMFAMQANANGIEMVAFVDGQPASVQAGSQSNNTTDQSQTYNVALVALKIQELKRANGESEDNIANMEIKDYHYGKGKGKIKYEYDINNVNMSVSSGESTISQIVSRNQTNVLNIGASATLDVAREIAQAIYGGLAVDIEASSIGKIIKQYNNKKGEERFKVHSIENKKDGTIVRTQIVEQGVQRAVDFLTGKDEQLDKKKEKVGLLFGAMDMSYNFEVMIRALAQLSTEEGRPGFTYEDIIKATRGYTLTQVLKYISKNYKYMNKYTDQIQIIDADVAGNHSDDVAIMSKTKGKLTFSNESGLRGVNFKSINMVILDAQNFPISELLQAIGRAGRNVEWGKDNAKVDIYMDKTFVDETFESMRKVDEYLQQCKGKGLFNNNHVTGDSKMNFNDIVRNNVGLDQLTSIDYLEIISTYKAMQLKSESILFKARQEAMYILIKEPLAQMAKKARDNGDITGAEFLTDLYKKAISNDENNSFEKKNAKEDDLSDPDITIKQVFSQVLKIAEVYLTEANDHEFKDSSINIDFTNRLVDIKLMSADGAIDKLIDAQRGETSYFENSFARANREADISQNKSPATDIAKTLIKLSKDVLPTAKSKNNSVSTVFVTAQETIKITETMTEEQKKNAEEYIKILNEDTTLSYTNSKGKRVLTEKGKIFAYFANRMMMPKEEWINFINSLLNVNLNETKTLTNGNKIDKVDIDKFSKDNKYQREILNNFVSLLWDNNIRDSKSVEALLNSYLMIDRSKEFTIETMQQIINPRYTEGLEDFVVKGGLGGLNQWLPPAQTIWLAKSDLLSDKKMQKTIIDNYNLIKNKFDDMTKNNIMVSQKLKSKYIVGITKIVPLLLYRFVNWLPIVKGGYFGFIGNIRKIKHAVNPRLNLLSLDKTEDEIKTQMALAGAKIDEKTDIAIKNMKAYLNNLKEKDKERTKQSMWKTFLFKIGRGEENKVRKKFKLDNINEFANMPKLIRNLSEENFIDLTEQEKSVLNALYPSDKKTKNDDIQKLLEKMKRTKTNTIGTVRKIVEEIQKKDKVEKRDVSKEEDILKIVFKMSYPSKNANDLIERYKYITNKDNFQFDLFDDMNISELADDNNFIKTEENGKLKIEATDKFKNKYNELLQNSTYSKLKDLMSTKLKTQLKVQIQAKLAEIKNAKNVNNDNSINDELKKVEEIEGKLKEKDLEQYSKQDLDNLKQELDSIGISYDSIEQGLKNGLNNYDIKYNKVKTNFNDIVKNMKVDNKVFSVEQTAEEIKDEAQKTINETSAQIKEIEENKTDKKQERNTEEEESKKEEKIKELKQKITEQEQKIKDAQKIINERSIEEQQKIDKAKNIIKDEEKKIAEEKQKITEAEDIINKLNATEEASKKIKEVQEEIDKIQSTTEKTEEQKKKDKEDIEKLEKEIKEQKAKIKKAEELKQKGETIEKQKEFIEKTKKVIEKEEQNIQNAKKTIQDVNIKEQLQKIVEKILTVKDLSDEKLIKQLIDAINKGVIVINKETTRETIIKVIKQLTLQQIRDKFKYDGYNFVNKYSGLLKMAELNLEVMKKNIKSMNRLFFNSEVGKNFIDKMDLLLSMEDLSNEMFEKDVLYSKTISQIVREDYEKKKYSELEITIRNNDALLKQIGLEQLSDNNNILKEALKKQNIEDKEIEDIIGNIKVEELNDSDYIKAVIDLLNAKIIKASDIKEGKNKVQETVKKNKYVDLAKELDNSENKADKVLKAIGMANVVNNIQALKETTTNKLHNIVIMNKTIEALFNEDIMDEMKLENMDKEANKLIENGNENGKIKDIDIDMMTLNEEEKETIRKAMLKNAIEKGAKYKIKTEKKEEPKPDEKQKDKKSKVEEQPLTLRENCAIIAGIVAEKSSRVIEVSDKDAFVDKTVSGLENIETKLEDVMKVTGTETALVTDNRAIKEGMMLVLEDTANKENALIITVMKVIGNRVIYAVDVKGKKDVIKAETTITDLEKGIQLTENEQKVGSIFKWNGLVLATYKLINNTEGITTVKDVQDMFNIEKDTAECIGVDGMKTLAKVIELITNPKKTNTAKVQEIVRNLGIDEKQELLTASGTKNEKIIMDKILKRMGEISEKDTITNVEQKLKATTTEGGLLLAMASQKVESAKQLKQTDINKNKATISKLLKDEYKGKKGKDDDFIKNLLTLKEKQQKELTVKNIKNIFNITEDKLNKIGQETLIAIINAITGTKVNSIEVKAIAKMLGVEVSQLTKSDIATKVFGNDNIDTMNDKEIIDIILTRMGDLSKEGNSADVKLAIELIAVAGGLLLAMKKQDVDKVIDLDQTTINSNQATISKMLKEEYNLNYMNKNDKDFIINLSQLQKAVTEKTTYTAQERKDILDALANGNRGQLINKDAEKVKNIFNMQYIREELKSA